MQSLKISRLLKYPALAAAALLGPHQHVAGQSLWVLMYHRLLPHNDSRFHAEEPGMVVTPETFRQHILTLRSLFDIVSLQEWIMRRERGLPLPSRACAITFDDGWRDNYDYLLPIIQKLQVPITIFAVSHMIGTARHFWPNRLGQLLQQVSERSQLPTFHWLDSLKNYSSKGVLSRDAIGHIIEECKRLPDGEIDQHIDAMEREIEKPPLAPALMSWDQLREMTATGLVDVGSHTCNHYRLTAAMPAAQMEHEIGESQRFLQQQLDRPVRLFCYPNGDVSAQGAAVVRRFYDAAVTNVRGFNPSQTDAFQIKRVTLHDDVSNSPMKLKARLSTWF